jgi:hypothetical protein
LLLDFVLSFTTPTLSLVGQNIFKEQGQMAALKVVVTAFSSLFGIILVVFLPLQLKDCSS